MDSGPFWAPPGAPCCGIAVTVEFAAIYPARRQRVVDRMCVVVNICAAADNGTFRGVAIVERRLPTLCMISVSVESRACTFSEEVNHLLRVVYLQRLQKYQIIGLLLQLSLHNGMLHNLLES